MTLSKAAKRERFARPMPERGDIATEIVRRIDVVLGAAAAERDRRPLRQYQLDPRGYADRILGVRLTDEQVAILLAVRDHRRCAVSGGRKVGKDFVCAVIAFWFYECFDDARVRLTAPKQEQVEDILWREMQRLWSGRGRCVGCKAAGVETVPCEHSSLAPEEMATLPRTGLKAKDLREIVGYTAREAEAAAGISGGNQLYIIDEASAVEDRLFDAIEGNLAGSTMARLVMISNPTREDGQFWRAFHREASLWWSVSLSSLEMARKYGGRIPGMATRDEIQGLIEKYGEGSDFVTVHVHGRFPERSVGKIFDVHSIEASIARWSVTPADGPLTIGVDVAGESGENDESAFAARRGLKLLSLHTMRGLKPEHHVTEVLRLIAANPKIDPTEDVHVVIDRGGAPGQKVWGEFIAYRQRFWQSPPFVLVGVDASRVAQRNPKAYRRVRDELVANLADWMRLGGAIVADPALHVELSVFRWVDQRIQTANELVDKRKMREQLGRSPDRADALALCCWSEQHWRPATAEARAAVQPTPEPRPSDAADANAIWYGEDQQPGAGGDPWWPSQ